jgi:hypothetical protein
MLVELHGQPGWVVALIPLSVDGMIVAAWTTLLADSRVGDRAECCPGRCWGGQCGELGRPTSRRPADPSWPVIAAWPSFALIDAYELLIREAHRSAGR